MIDPTETVGWRKSTHSTQGSDTCVEVGTSPGAVAVRDSKDPEGPRLAFTGNEWRTFTSLVKRDQL